MPTSSTTTTLQNPDWVQGTHVFDYGNLRIGVIGIELKETPELVSAGATAGLKFLDEVETIKAESEKLRQQGVKVQIVLIHQGTPTWVRTPWTATRLFRGTARS